MPDITKKIMIIVLLIGIFFIGYLSRPQAQEEVIFNIDAYDYFIFQGKKLTFSGVCEAIIEERKAKFINELVNTIFRKE